MTENSINIKNENEIELMRRTKDNYTHESLRDKNIKEITSWKRAKKNLGYYFFLNIFTCGIINLISKYKPLLFIKLYCISSIPEEADFFLVKDIYGEYELCPKEIRINKYMKTNWEISEDLNEEFIPGITSNNNKNLSAQMTGFYYNSNFYEFSESTQKIIPIFFNLVNLTNKEIIKLFIDGLSEDKVKKYKERFGLNTFPINHNLTQLYFLKVELGFLIVSIILLIFEAILGNVTYCIIILVFIIIIFVKQYFYIKKLSFNNEITLESEKSLIKVKRKNNANNSTNNYININFIDLLPGDVIYLKEGEIAPCDGIILEGECFVDISSVNGIVAEIRKKSLDNNNIKFNYEKNKNSILLHGSKIITSYSKLEGNSILILCINTGNNTYKANQLENILNLFKRNKKYKRIYSPLCGKRFKLFIHCVCLLLIATSLLLGIHFISVKKNISLAKYKDLILIILQVICRCFLPTFHVINSAIILFGNSFLSKENIQVYDKSRLLYSGFINTVFFDKTGTLTEKKLDINGFFPVCIYKSQLCFKFYFKDQIKNLSSELIDYYNKYINNNQNFFESNNNISYSKIQDYFPKNIGALFIECMMCCNSLEKINNKIFGNTIEAEIFTLLKWEMKIQDDEFEDENNENINKVKNSEEKNPNDEYCKYKIKILQKKVEIYPNNYYKIKEKNKKFNNKLDDDDNNEDEFSRHLITYSSIKENKNNGINNIVEDIKKNENDYSYKLKIYKRFIKIGTLYSSAIVYNPLMKTLHFMTKGPFEDIIPNCDINYLPKDFSKIISYYRRNGYDFVVLASKIINKFEYNESFDEDYYMNNLLFCGIITLKNKIKKDVKQAIQKLKNLNCDLILSTGDNIYNALSVGYESEIISSKNVYVFDLNKINKKIFVSNFTQMKKLEQNKNNLEKTSTKNFKQQKQTKNKEDNNKDSNKVGKISPKITPSKSNFNKKYGTKKVSSLNLHAFKDIPVKKENSNESNIELKKPLVKQISLEIDFLQNSNSSLTGIVSPRKNVISKINNTKKNLLNSFTKGKGNKRISISSTNNFNDNLRSTQLNNNLSIKRTVTKNTSQILKIFKPEYEYEYNPNKLKEMRNDCVYCVSGSALKFIYDNRYKPEYKKYEFPILLNHIKKFGKIFYKMKSLDKSFLIDYYRKIPNTITCMVGDSQNDIDAIMTSHVGININLPINTNTILCHFYPNDGSLLCIEKIIKYGRVIYENIYLFAVTTFFWVIMTICYICFIYYFEGTTDTYKLDFFSYCFFILSILAFTVKPNISNKNEPLFHNYNIFKRYFIIQAVCILIVNIIYNILFMFIFRKNKTIEYNQYKQIFGTYYYIFNIFQMLSIQFSINSINFYRTENQYNYIYIFLFLTLITIFSFIICIFEFSFSPKIISNINFEYSSINVDTFDDYNKLKCFLILIGNFTTCYLVVIILFNLFKKKANTEYERRKNKMNVKNE